MAEKKKSVFETLNAINVNEHTEKKGNLTYLSWAWAWQKIKENYPDAFYTIYENADGLFYHTDGKTAWVKTGVTIEGIEHIEYLPVMDYKNNSISLEKLTSTDVNKTIQRSLTKACARHGLGLYIYAGEDLPNPEQEKQKEAERKGQEEMEKRLNAKITEREVAVLTNMLKPNQVEWVLQQCNINQLKDMTARQFAQVMEALNKQGQTGR